MFIKSFSKKDLYVLRPQLLAVLSRLLVICNYNSFFTEVETKKV